MSRRVTTITQGNLAIEPEWRREVSSRLEEYRSRRRPAASPDLQTALPFESNAPILVESAVATQEPEPAPPPRKSNTSRATRSERFEIEIPRNEPGRKATLFEAAPAARVKAAVPAQEPLRFVASLSERRRAALADAGLLAFSYGGMLALFMVLGGRIGLNKTDLLLAGATFVLFYVQYFSVFTVFGGATPGMMLRRLRVASFDGGVPTSRQMVWRSVGYLISAGSCFLGFVWALWDDDHLCWQDRISETYLTPVEADRRY